MATRKREKKSEISADQTIIDEAKKRFARCEEWYGEANKRYISDLKFVHADSDNGWQWPEEIKQLRGAERPMLTINKTRQFCLDITNDAKQNKASCKINPVGEKATMEGAQTMQGIVRHIEYQSNAQTVYDKANETQVQGGKGYWRVSTDYADNESLDQEIFIKWLKDANAVYLDPDKQQPDGSDSRFGFIFEDLAKDRFDADYPKFKDDVGGSSVLNNQKPDGWLGKDHVRVAEYFRRVGKTDELILYTSQENGRPETVRASKLPKDVLEAIKELPDTKTRPVTDYTVEWYKIAGDMIVDRGTWVGSTIPIVEVVGETYVLDGKYDCKGHARGLKDPQRMYNYYSSSGVEATALQGKTPWLASARAIKGYMPYWSTANTTNHSVLPYNDLDDKGQPILPPTRPAPPTMPDAYLKGMAIAAEELRMVSGQHDLQQPPSGNPEAYKTVNARQRKGDNANYHFINNLAVGVVYTGKILVEIIPKIYDTKRIIKILGEDGSESAVSIDPDSAKEIIKRGPQDKATVIFNPSFAKYSVQADIGPAYATRRQEAFNAFTQIMAGNPQLMTVAGDLMFKAADFPLADELAERLKRMVPKDLLGEGPDAATKALMDENGTLKTNIQLLLGQYAEVRAQNAGTKADKTINEYKAETERLSVLLKDFKPEQIAQFTARLVLAELQGQPLGTPNVGADAPGDLPGGPTAPVGPEAVPADQPAP